MSETAGGLYTEEQVSVGAWTGERKLAAGTGACYFHGNLYHRKKKNFSAAGTHFYETEELQYTETDKRV